MRKIANSKIKTQIIFYISLAISLIIIIQIFLYSVLKYESRETITNIFNSVSQSTVNQIEKLNDDITELSISLTANNIIQDAIYKYTPSDFIKNRSALQNVVDEYCLRNKNIGMLAVYKNNSIYIYNDMYGLSNVANDFFISIQNKKISKPTLLPPISHNGNAFFICITPIFPIGNNYLVENGQNNYIICLYKTDISAYTPYKFINNEFISLILVDNSSRILMSSNNNDYGKVYQEKKSNKNLYVKTFNIKDTTWNAIVEIPLESISILRKTSNLFIIFMLIFNLFIIFILINILNNTIAKRVMILKEKTLQISKNSSSYRIKYDYNDELCEIAVATNEVLEQLHALNKEKLENQSRLYKSEILHNEMQILQLQGQVSPHFLYNSMAYIQGMALKYNVKEIVDITLSMSKIFRYFSSGAKTSNIKSDLECALEYFNVINTRRNNPIIIHNEVNENLYQVSCLKMIFQPLIENILKHAFDINESGEVKISSVDNDEKAIIEIWDNGKGFKKEKLEEINKLLTNLDFQNTTAYEHIGILNTHLRIKTYYGDGNGITISSEDGAFTCVRVSFDKICKINA